MMKVFFKVIALLLAVSILHFAGVFFGIYEYQIQQGNVWFDNVLHVLDGVIFAYAWISYKKEKVTFVNAIAFVFALAVGWEIIEYAFMSLLPSQAIELKIYSPSAWEATEDIMSNTLGAIIFFLLRKK